MYEFKDVKKQNILQKLLKQEPKENAIVKINNIFYENKDNLEKIDKNEIEKILSDYKIKKNSKYFEWANDLFTKALSIQIHNNKVDKQILNHIIEALSLDENYCNNLISEFANLKYEASLSYLYDRGVDISNKTSKIEKLQNDLCIPEEKENEIYAKIIEEKFFNLLNEVMRDERFSPDEEKKLKQMIKKYDMPVNLSYLHEGKLKLYRYYWEIEHGDIPEIEGDISLPKSEKLYFKNSADYYEHRTQTKTIRYGGPVVSFKIMKGIYWRAGNLSVERVSEDIMKHIDSGDVYLTSKKLIFIGNRGVKNVRLNKILMMEPFSNGVKIIKDSGKPMFIEMENDAYVFSMILYRLMEEQA